MTDIVESVAPIDQQELAQELVDKARTEGVNLIGPGGLLTGLTKDVLETALEAEMSDHLGYDKHDPTGRNRGNSRNGTRGEDRAHRDRTGRSRCRATGTAPSTRSWCVSGNAAWMGSTRS